LNLQLNLEQKAVFLSAFSGTRSFEVNKWGEQEKSGADE